MPKFDWIYPGLNVKRWIVVISAGIFFIFLGGIGFAVYLLTVEDGTSSSKSFLGIIFPIFLVLGFTATAYGIHGITQTLIRVLSGSSRSETRVLNKAMRRFSLSEGPKVVAFGGGTGMGQLLTGVKEHTSNIVAVVTVADNGGHSGMLRKDLEILPPGDVRQCLVALADSEPTMSRLMQYRFESLDMEGFNFGNLLLAAMTKITGTFTNAVEKTSDILSIRGRVIPSTDEMVSLVATYEDGTRSTGEVEVARYNKRITELALRPKPAPASRDILEAIEDADLILLAPGSLYTSILPNLIIDGVVNALIRARAPKVYICNTMTQPGETSKYTASDHIRAIYDIVGRDEWIDFTIVNNKVLPNETLDRYAQQGSQPVEIDHENLKAMNVKIIQGNFVDVGGQKAHHNPSSVAFAALQLAAG